MIAVIFEAEPQAGEAEIYFDIAAALRGQLQSIDGFVSIERFESTSHRGRYLSLSFWRDEAAIAQWRNTTEHRTAQERGRRSIFKDYRLRIAHVVRDYGMHERTEAPSDSKAAHGFAT